MRPEPPGSSDRFRFSWPQIFTHWRDVECDLQDCGIDLADTALMEARSWRWLRVRIYGLMRADTRLSRALAPPPKQNRR